MNKVRLSRKVIVSGNQVWFFRDINIGDEIVTHGRRGRRTPNADLVTRNVPFMTESSANRLQNLLNEAQVWVEFDIERGHMSFVYDFAKVIRYVHERPKPITFDFGECDDSCTCKCHGPSMIPNCGCDCGDTPHDPGCCVAEFGECTGDDCWCECHDPNFGWTNTRIASFVAEKVDNTIATCGCLCHDKPYKYIPDCGCDCGKGTGM